MSGLADELLADLEGLSENEEYEEESRDSKQLSLKRKASSDDEMSEEDREVGAANEELPVEGGLVLEGGIKPAEELDEEDVERMELGDIEDITKVAKLDGSKRMTETLKVCSLIIFDLKLIVIRKLRNMQKILVLPKRWRYQLIRIPSTNSLSEPITCLWI